MCQPADSTMSFRHQHGIDAVCAVCTGCSIWEQPLVGSTQPEKLLPVVNCVTSEKHCQTRTEFAFRWNVHITEHAWYLLSLQRTSLKICKSSHMFCRTWLKKLFSTSWVCKVGCLYFKISERYNTSLFRFQETLTVGSLCLTCKQWDLCDGNCTCRNLCAQGDY